MVTSGRVLTSLRRNLVEFCARAILRNDPTYGLDKAGRLEADGLIAGESTLSPMLAYFDRPGTPNGPIEAMNGRLEHLREYALGFRTLASYIAPLVPGNRRIQATITLAVMAKAAVPHPGHVMLHLTA